MRLKSRTRFPPGSFQILIPEIGMKAPVKGSFAEVVDAFGRIVAANRTLAEKHGWPTNREDQEAWIDAREAKRLVANGWYGFVDLEGEQPAQKKTQGMIARAGNAAAESKTALAIYKDLFAGEKPVSRELAEARATVCVDCPLNDTSKSLAHYFREGLARSLTSLWGMMNDLSLTTSHDAKLGVCTACECPMRAKVFVPLKVLKAHMTRAQFDKLDTRCWIPSEINAELDH